MHEMRIKMKLEKQTACMYGVSAKMSLRGTAALWGRIIEGVFVRENNKKKL